MSPTRQFRSQRQFRTQGRSSQRRTGARRHEYATQQSSGPPKPQPVRTDAVRIIPLGGLGEVGRNMMLFEYAGKILIVDAGFRMPEEDMPGIDYIIPNISYLQGRQKDIVGILITHGHYDHIAAIPYLIEKLGYPPIFTAPLSKAIILKRQEDFSNLKPLDITEVKAGEKIVLPPFRLEFVHMTHNIPHDLALYIQTPMGNILHSSDWKFDETPMFDMPSDFEKYAELGNRGVDLLLSDSTGAENPGRAMSEKTIMENLDKIFESAGDGKIIAATFASLISRIQQIILLSEKYGRKVVTEGYSMKTNVEITRALNYLKVEKNTIITAKQAQDYPDSKITVVCTGAQGEGNAVLMRIANKEHPHIHLKKGDTVIFSSSVIPGNERTVQYVKDNLYRQGAKVYHYKMMDIHSSGHAQQEDLKDLIKILKPRFFMPIHGQYSMLVNHGWLAQEMRLPQENIMIAENGQVVLLQKDKITLTKEIVDSNMVMVDGLGVGDVGSVVLRDRQMLAADGVFVIIAVVDRQTRKVLGSPDIISRGFVYLRESKELLREVRKKVIAIANRATGEVGEMNSSYVKDELRNKVGQFLFQKTQRRPMVLPVIIEV